MKKLFNILLLIVFSLATINAQIDPENFDKLTEILTSKSLESVWIEPQVARIYPTPKEVEYSDEYLDLFDKGNNAKAVLVATEDCKKAANVFNKQLENFGYPALPLKEENSNSFKIVINLKIDKSLAGNSNNQAYSIKWNNSSVDVTGASLRGLAYGSASLAQLITKQNGKITVRRANVIDYPEFTKRWFNSRTLAYHLSNDLDWMTRYKLGSITFHNKDYSWDKLDSYLTENLVEFKKWKSKYDGVDAVLALNLYRGETPLQVTNSEHIKYIKNVIATAFEHGVTGLMLLVDDSPPFTYGEGYTLTSTGDKEKFENVAEATVYLSNLINTWQKENGFDLNIIYCPSFYTYEEMHYGDMALFKNTPWEEDAFGPLHKELSYVGNNLDKDIDIFWTGRYVCSREITDNDLKEWAENLQGRVPFLFDNTIFAQHDFTAATMFTAFSNRFPENFAEKTGGNGIFINGDATGETSRAASMTCNDYMWQGDKYNYKTSLIDAMTCLYGDKLVSSLIKYKETELELRKTIKERELWFASQELWKAVRDTRFTTEKNPFYYHLNYTRFKALTLQLKSSVPEPKPVNVFKEKCVELDKTRKELIAELKSKNYLKLAYALETEMIELPDFDNIN